VATKRDKLKFLAANIERLGGVRAKIALLEASERDLSKTVRLGLEEAGCSAFQSEHYAAQFDERRSLTIDPAKFRKLAGDEVFIECARVDAKQARARFAEEQLERCGEVTTSRQLRVSAIPTSE
jgi:hypothetical protein